MRKPVICCGGRRNVVALILFLATAYPADEIFGQPGPELVHAGIECIPSTQFVVLSASIRPDEEVKTARVYFRSDKYPDFYYVDMTSSEDEFRAVLPKPTPETARVFYYIEAISIGFNSTRSLEHDPVVVEDEDECRRRGPVAAYFMGESPGIVVGALRTGIPPVPPGFLADGIAGFVSFSASGGGGPSTGVVIGGIAAGVAGGAGIGLLASSGEETTTTAVTSVMPSPPASSTISPTTTPPAPAPVKACFKPTPAPPVIEVGERIKLDARCSEPAGSITYMWDLGDGRTKEGAFIEPSYHAPGIYTVVLTVRRATSLVGLGQSFADEDVIRRDITVHAPPPPPEPPQGPSVDLFVTKQGVPDPVALFFEEVLTYTIQVENLGPAPATGVQVVDDYPPELIVLDDGGCAASGPNQLTCNLGDIPNGGFRDVIIRLGLDFQSEPSLGNTIENDVTVSGNEVDPNPGNNNYTTITGVDFGQFASSRLSKDVSFTSDLEATGSQRRASGHIVLNGAQAGTASGRSPQRYHLKGAGGRNVIEAYPMGGFEGEALWRFDFRGSERFIAGSIRVELGQVVSLDGHAVVFRLSEPRERIKFAFQLKR